MAVKNLTISNHQELQRQSMNKKLDSVWHLSDWKSAKVGSELMMCSVAYNQSVHLHIDLKKQSPCEVVIDVKFVCWQLHSTAKKVFALDYKFITFG